MKETWKVIPDTKDLYEASDLGRIRRVESYARNQPTGNSVRKIRQRVLSQKTKSNDYKEVSLNMKGTSKSKYVHRLVVKAFIGDIPKGYNVNHKDGDKSNNTLDNLEIVTVSENCLHAVRVLGRVSISFKGEEHPMTKLTDEDVLFIRSKYVKGSKNEELYEMFSDKVSLSCFRKILYNNTWKHLLR